MSVKTIGVMTGNSLDAVDAVLTGFDQGEITDIASHTLPYPRELTEDLLVLRKRIKEKDGDISSLENESFFNQTVTRYSSLVAKAVNALCASSGIDKQEIAAIGLHGQTCDHFPPSVAGTKAPYTLQIADAALIANLTDIPVIYDFRSDDLMNGGEGAPLAPLHNRHIAADLKRKGLFPVAFCNAGNTGNISVISQNDAGKETVSGWDIGPFNHFADLLVRTKENIPCDLNGEIGRKGEIVPAVLSELFETAARTSEGKNFYLQPPPKSSDPQWYQADTDKLCRAYGFENVLRTVEYLSAYTFVHSLNFIAGETDMPHTFLLFGGGWKNPLIRQDFQTLLAGKGLILKQHQNLFSRILSRFFRSPEVFFSDRIGYSGEYMEARIFADMAYCRIIKEPFTLPETTNCKTPTVCGIYVLPETNGHYLLTDLLDTYKSADLTDNSWNKKYNRAAKGWQSRLNQTEKL